MTIYWSIRRIDWHRSVPVVDWLPTDAPSAPLNYPPALDLVESALSRRPTPLLEAAAAALAPRWEELGRAREPADPDRRDAPDEEDDTEERLVLYAAARAISQLGKGHGCVLAVGHETEPSVRYFITQLAQQAEDTGFALACTGETSTFPAEELPRGLARFPDRTIPPPATPLGGLALADRRALTVLAVSHVGAPLTAALRLGLGQDAADALTRPGPGGVRWIMLSGGTRRRLRAGLDRRDRRRHAVALFDAWPPDGWGYLRRSPLAIAGRDRTRLRGQHAALFAGFAIIGRELLQRHAAAVAATVTVGRAGSKPARECQIAAHVAAAHLASRLRPVVRSEREAAAHLRRARRLATDPVEQLDLTYELANSFAKQRTSNLLIQARSLYVRGLRDLAAVEDTVQRIRLEITLLNGLALVDYFEGADESALKLEERAERLAFGLAEQQPKLARWAFALVGVNIAKLLAVRFRDRQGAIAKLATALTMTQSDPESADKIRRDLARLHFAEGDYLQVIRLLEGLCPESRLGNARPRDEFHDRLLLAVAQLKQGEIAACRGQFTPLRMLATREGSDAARSVLAVLAQAL
jgi:hypothetical protein